MTVNWEWREEFIFLLDLRDSGITNMFGASPYLSSAFGHDRNLSIQILGHWMENFAEIQRELRE